MKHHQHDKCGVCKIPAFERNNFFYGKLMTVRDFCDEQRYFNEKRWLLNRMISGWGVVCGLDVTVDTESGATNRLSVSPGLALDCCGREILVCEKQYLGLEALQPAPGTQMAPEKIYICLEYHECKTEALNLPPTACDADERGEFNRVRDSFKLRLKRESEIRVSRPFGKHCPWMETKQTPVMEYMITQQSLDDLKEDENANPDEYDDIVKAIDEYGVKDTTYIGLSEFREMLKEVLGEYFDNWVELLVQYAEKNSRNHCTTEFQITEDVLNRMLEEEIIDQAIIDLLHQNGVVDKVFFGRKAFRKMLRRVLKKMFTPELFKAFARYSRTRLYAADYESLHQNLTRHLKHDCPACPENGCLVLATFEYDAKAETKISAFDTSSERRLVYNNALLYDLLHCLHGDLPHIIGINWYHLHGRTDVTWDEFSEVMSEGLTICFDKDMDYHTFNEYAFQVAVINKSDDTGYLTKRYIPLHKDETLTSPVRKFVFKAPDIWEKEELNLQGGYSKLRKLGANIEITIRGSMIMEYIDPDKPGSRHRAPRALDADFIDGKFPTGNGSQGGDFVSWFRVRPKQKKDDDEA